MRLHWLELRCLDRAPLGNPKCSLEDAQKSPQILQIQKGPNGGKIGLRDIGIGRTPIPDALDLLQRIGLPSITEQALPALPTLDVSVELDMCREIGEIKTKNLSITMLELLHKRIGVCIHGLSQDKDLLSHVSYPSSSSSVPESAITPVCGLDPSSVSSGSSVPSSSTRPSQLVGALVHSPAVGSVRLIARGTGLLYPR